MTPLEAFETGGRNSVTRLWVHDWHVLGCLFSPTPVEYQGGIVKGMRIMDVVDVASYHMMHCEPIPDHPKPLGYKQIVSLLETTFAKFQPPRIGIVISHSAWLSSQELFLDEDTAPQGEYLIKNEIEFGPMAQCDKERICDWGKSVGLPVEFNADNINNY